MTITILLPLAVALLGALLYGFAPGKAQELGRLMFAMGLLAAMIHLSARVLELR
ncbi:MAG: hypothetical protein ACREU5_06855 [Burkholderiales bacterium]